MDPRAPLFPGLSRQIANLVERQSYATHCDLLDYPHQILFHRSPLLRPFPGFDPTQQRDKIPNLRRVVEGIDGLVIQPGEAFSFWRRVGAPRRRRKFVPAQAPLDGIMRTQTGGGIVQASNLIFWLLAHSPLVLIERWRHAYDCFADCARTQPFGSGATVLYPHRDLRLKNQSTQSFQIRLWLSPTHLNGTLNSDAPLDQEISIVESDHRIHEQSQGVYSRHNKLWRQLGTQKTLLVENNALLTYDPNAA